MEKINVQKVEKIPLCPGCAGQSGIPWWQNETHIIKATISNKVDECLHVCICRFFVNLFQVLGTANLFLVPIETNCLSYPIFYARHMGKIEITEYRAGKAQSGLVHCKFSSSHLLKSVLWMFPQGMLHRLTFHFAPTSEGALKRSQNFFLVLKNKWSPANSRQMFCALTGKILQTIFNVSENNWKTFKFES